MEPLEKREKIRLAVNIAVLVLFAATFTYVSIRYASEITQLISKPRKFRNLLLSYGSLSVFVFMFFQVLHVIVAFIPGEFVQIAGGYVYGTYLGTLYSVTGILAGTMIVFFFARLFGFALVKTFIAPKKIEKLNFLMNGPKGEIAMFVLYLIPGLPKDTLNYIAGLTPVKPMKFFAISMIARMPGIIGSSIIGANLQKNEYMTVVVVSILSILLFLAGVLFRDRIIHWLSTVVHAKKAAKQTAPERLQRR